jgi:hypothetical protein
MEREMGLEVPEAMREMFGSLGKTDRTNANLYYANTAKEVVEFFAEQVRTSPTDDPVRSAKRRLGLDWILGRQTVLTEIGRTMDEEPSAEVVARFEDLVMSLADRYDKLTAKTAVARIRRARLGETARRERVASLHHDLNAAVNLHRQRFPESTWKDVRRALRLTVEQIERKL